MMTFDLCEDNRVQKANGKEFPERATILSLMIKPFEMPNTPQNRIYGLFALLDQLFSEQHNPHSVMVSRCLKMIDNLLQKSQRIQVTVSPPKQLSTQAFVERMAMRAKTLCQDELHLPSTLQHTAEQFHEAFSTLYSLVEEKLSQFYLGEEFNMQQMVAHHSGLAQAFHAFRSSLFSFCRLFFQEQLYKLMHLPANEIESKLGQIYSNLLDAKCERLAVI